MKQLTKLLGLYFNSLSMIAPDWSAQQAFYLFCYPFKAKLGSRQQAFLKTGQSFRLKVDGKNVQYYSWGTGKDKILFVHGWQSNSYRWKPYIEAFDKTKYTLYAFDAPGHGNSESRIGNIPLYEKSISALINAKGNMHHFVAHSIGSFACASFMFHHNYTVKNYISLASPFSASEFFEYFYEQLILTERSKNYLVNHFKVYTGYPLEHYSLENFSSIIQPERTLIIHDSDDKSIPQKNAIRFFNLLKESNRKVELKLTEGLGHNLRGKMIVGLVVDTINDYQKYTHFQNGKITNVDDDAHKKPELALKNN